MDTTAHPESATVAPADELHGLLTRALGHQRWFPAKGAEGELRPLARLELHDPLGRARVEVRLLGLPTGAVLQVPVTLRDAGTPAHADDDDLPDPAVLGTVGALTVRDGPHDPAFVRAWLAAATPAAPDGGADPAVPPVLPVPPARAVHGMRVLEGEQSNTSVLLPAAEPPGILKVFRVLSPGPSPDVDVPLALSSAGWAGVPRPLAWLAARWPAADDGAVGHLGVLSELVPDAEDGFRLACARAAAGEDLGALAEDLGRTTAQMHRALRRALPVEAPSRGRVVEVLRERAVAAFAAVPELRERAAGVERVLGRLGSGDDLPPLQRVHGDYHLGQVLHSPGGWRVLDFEGEPQASAAERTRPDLALRDLAGMLRSLDYAAAVGHASSQGWVERARERLVAGYAAGLGDGLTDGHGDGTDDPSGVGTPWLLRALELDKALYEVVYESRNRPDWQHIPLAGVDRLLADDQAAAGR